MDVNLVKESFEYMKGIYRFQERLGEGNIVLTYQGEVTQDIIRSLTSLIETNISRIEENETVIARVYHVLIECMQNIIKHSAQMPNSKLNRQQSGIFLGETSDVYIVTVGNLIGNENVESFTTMIDNLNGLDRKALKALYMDVVYNGEVSEKGGAGIGYIEMKRKVAGPIEYHLEKVNDELSYLLVNFNIAKS